MRIGQFGLKLFPLVFGVVMGLSLYFMMGLSLYFLTSGRPSTLQILDTGKKSVLVTGVAGYIGSHMALQLLEEGFTVLGVDNLSRGSELALTVLKKMPNFRFIYLDLGDSHAVDHLFAQNQFGVVFHFAAIAFVSESVELPDLYYRNITNNTRILVDSMLRYKVSHLVYSSTCAVYGNPEVLPITEETPLRPVSPYGRAKLEAEAYIISKASPAFRADLMRYLNVVGADSRSRMGENPKPHNRKYCRLWTACLDVIFKQRMCVDIRDSALPTQDGTSIRDYVHVEDLVTAHLAVLRTSTNRNFEVWDVATNSPISTLKFIETARRVTGHFIPICFGNRSEEASPPVLFASGDRIRRKTGWRPKYSDLHESLRTAWQWANRISNVQDWRSFKYDICLVGAGLSAAVLAERHVTSKGHSVLVMEKRDHIGGNCYDYIDDETGIRVSKYGVHLFHTKYNRVWKYIQRFSRWNPWEHRCVARVGDKLVPVPVNIDTVNKLFQTNISNSTQMANWLAAVQIPPRHGIPSNSEEVGLQRVGAKLYDLIFKPYTFKQWNKDPRDLGPSVLARIPVRMNYDDRYFTDPHQALPTDGYTRIFENMFNSPLITLRLNTDYFTVKDQIRCGHTYYTGPIDAYFATIGMPKLEYRSLNFERRVYRNTKFFQMMAHVNYPGLEYDYTRAIEYKHLLHQQSNHTVVFFERSTDVGEPYYPVPNGPNQALYAKYQKLADNEANISFVGRLANYKYFNMDETILNALELFDNNFLRKSTMNDASRLWKMLPLENILQRFGNCSHIFITVAFFTGVKAGRQRTSHEDQLPIYEGPRGCGVFFASKNLFSEFDVHKLKGWQPVWVDLKFHNVSDSNEVQRNAHLVKIIAPNLFRTANFVSYGDLKCNANGVHPSRLFMAYSKLMPPDVHVVVQQHPDRFQKPLYEEFDATVLHMKNRGEPSSVFADMDRLKILAARNTGLYRRVYMPDTYCLHYRVSPETSDFSLKWENMVENYSMREQLSFNMAMDTSILNHSGRTGKTEKCYFDGGGVWYAPGNILFPKPGCP